MPTCKVILAWSSPPQKCGKKLPCDYHSKGCANCGAKATRECTFAGQLVCGAPLCDNCAHIDTFPGTHGTKQEAKEHNDRFCQAIREGRLKEFCDENSVYTNPNLFDKIFKKE